MTTEEPLYISCSNCGKWIEKASAVSVHYCNNDCTLQYADCHNCGKYFIVKKDQSTEYCADCIGLDPKLIKSA